MKDYHKHNVDIFNMIGSILNHHECGEITIRVDDLRIVLGYDEWADFGYAIEIISFSGGEYSISVGKSNEESYKKIYPEGVYLHYDTDGFYNLAEKLGYKEGDDDRVIYDHLKKYCRNINIEKILENQ